MSSDEDITIQNYTDKSFVVRGDTKKYREYLKNLGGKWNSSLTDKETGEKFGGWIFPSIKQRDVKNWYNNRESLESDNEIQPITTGVSRLLSSIGVPTLENKTNTASIEVMFKQIMNRLDNIEQHLGIKPKSATANTEITAKRVTIKQNSKPDIEDTDLILDEEEPEINPGRRLLGKK